MMTLFEGDEGSSALAYAINLHRGADGTPDVFSPWWDIEPIDERLWLANSSTGAQVRTRHT